MLQSTSAYAKMLGGVTLAAGLAVSAMAATPAAGSPAPAARAVKAVRTASAVPATHATPASGAAAAKARLNQNLHRLRVCESGNNYRENSGNGYYGAYQFARSTWHAIGFHGRPDHAKHVTQNRAAMKLHNIQGWSAWPSCARAEHLAG